MIDDAFVHQSACACVLEKLLPGNLFGEIIAFTIKVTKNLLFSRIFHLIVMLKFDFYSLSRLIS